MILSRLHISFHQPTMSGTRNQARRRSAEGMPYKTSSVEDLDTIPDDDSNITVGYGSAKYTLNVPDPDTFEIAKAGVMNTTMYMSMVNILR